MKHFYLLAIFFALMTKSVAAQTMCNSNAVSYDLVVFSQTVIPPNASISYINSYVCGGATLYDSAYCCTRMCHVDSLATLITGPNSYGIAYVKAGGTFNGQGNSQNWQVIAESGSNILNHTGNIQNCTSVTFPAALCFMTIEEQFGKQTSVALNGSALMFRFSSEVSDPRIELRDVNGKLVKSENSPTGTFCTVNVVDLAEGIYFWTVYEGSSQISSGKIPVLQ
jgi:hypothetical protein